VERGELKVCPQCGKEHPGDAVYCTEDGACLVESHYMDLGEPEPPQELVLGAYRLQGLLGEGGMGRVFRAEHTALGRPVALKMLREDYASHPDAVARFFNEARVVNRIRHENIVEITDFIEQPGGENYYIMELLEGRSLADVLASEGPLPAERAVGIATQMCAALEAAHHQGVVHRDLKTENVFLVERLGCPDFVKILDFGVAKLLDVQQRDAMKSTAKGAVLGTVEYMSPEQARGMAVDQRTDIYALGVVLYEMLTGDKPFTGSSIGEVVAKHLNERPPKPSRSPGLRQPLPAGLDEVVLDCLAKKPARRPASMAVVAARLAAVAREAGWELSPVGRASLSGLEPLAGRRLAGWVRRRPLVVAAAAILLAGAGVATWQLARQPKAVSAAASQPGKEAPAGPDVRGAQQPPQRVAVELRSQPSGAEVWQQGRGEPAGRTPLRLELDRSAAPVHFAFRKSGYRTAHEKLAPIEDAAIEVDLQPSEEDGADPSPAADSPKGERGAVQHATGDRRQRPRPPRERRRPQAPIARAGLDAAKPADAAENASESDDAEAAAAVPEAERAGLARGSGKNGPGDGAGTEPAEPQPAGRDAAADPEYELRGTVDPFDQLGGDTGE
jgi:serine/threonine-protein kinase